MPQYTAAISVACLQLTDRLRGSLIHRAGKDELKRVLNNISYTPVPEIAFTSVTLRSRIERFSEQSIADAESELAAYFSFQTGRALYGDYSDFWYFNSKGPQYLFNKSVAAAIGEGLAGF